MKRVIILLAILMAIASFSWAEEKVLMIIAKHGFRDEELFVPKEILESNGYEVEIASTSAGRCKGMLGKEVVADISLHDVDVDNYSAVIFVGGIGAKSYWNNARAREIARTAYQKGKIVGAICLAPGILARAGILKGKKATIWPGAKSVLISEGAIYTGSGVEKDGRIITADGPGSAWGFGEKILEELKNRAGQ
jgi:protease I